MEEFFEGNSIGKEDLLFVSNSMYESYFKQYEAKAAMVINYKEYGQGEPTDLMVEKIYSKVKGITYRRVIGVGGGAVLDIAKLFALEQISPVLDLYDRKLPIVKKHELILIPTTCGTGSEVTNISVLELTDRNTKLGLAVDELYADKAVLIPELLENLPFTYFATSSIDALIHAVESYVSPKANEFTKMFAVKAMEQILTGYQRIVKQGKETRREFISEFLLASTYAGISFGNAGCGAVHAMSFPFGGAYHIPHGEANYTLFTGVFRKYAQMHPTGTIQELNLILSNVLQCETEEVYPKLEQLLEEILPKKSLREYGVKEEEVAVFAASVIEKQQRLLANCYVPLEFADVLSIYQALY